jgi:hypothetical protein
LPGRPEGREHEQAGGEKKEWASQCHGASWMTQFLLII